MIIAIDFDGTIVEHEYPDVGSAVPGAISCMKQLQEAGHKLILYTMRDGAELAEAVEYCRGLGVEFWNINKNPQQRHWTSSPKIYAKVYIDDAAIGVPLRPGIHGGRMMVDWSNMLELLAEYDG